MKQHFISPGKPVENAYIESFNSLLRKECLNGHWFETMDDAKLSIERWRRDYNQHRPHGSLNDETPQEFLSRLVVEQGVHEAEILT
ncbi:MAG: transposase [Acidobacteriota bacterium]|nr:MAG: transposase [Acidobacteriota bacterium]